MAFRTSMMGTVVPGLCFLAGILPLQRVPFWEIRGNGMASTGFKRVHLRTLLHEATSAWHSTASGIASCCLAEEGPVRHLGTRGNGTAPLGLMLAKHPLLLPD